MKILMMTNTYYPIMGGLEKSIHTFTKAYQDMGHRVKIVVPQLEEGKSQEEHVIRLPSIQKFSKTDFAVNIPIPGILDRLFNAFKPDVIHAHHPFLVGDMALRLSGQYDIPLVFTYHTMFEQYTDYFALDQEPVQEFVMKLAAGYANLADHVITPSESVAEILRARRVKSAISVVPTGMDPQKFSQGNGLKVRQEFKISEDAFVIGHVGRFSKEKNLDFLSEVISIFLAQTPEAFFLVTGKGDYEEKMKELFRRDGVQDQVVFTGVRKDQDLIDTYHAADIFAFASKSETQGMVLTEAMSAGLPVIGLDGPGVREVVKDNRNGYLVMEESFARYVKHLRLYFEKSPEEREIFRKNARKMAEEFSIEKCAKKGIQVYEEAMSHNPCDKNIEDKPWKLIMNRVETEWSIFRNISKATRAALLEAVSFDFFNEEKKA